MDSTATRWFTLRTIPMIAAVASTSTEWLILFNPNASIVFFWRSLLSITLFIWVILIFAMIINRYILYLVRHHDVEPQYMHHSYLPIHQLLLSQHYVGLTILMISTICL